MVMIVQTGAQNSATHETDGRSGDSGVFRLLSLLAIALVRRAHTTVIPLRACLQALCFACHLCATGRFLRGLAPRQSNHHNEGTNPDCKCF